MTLDVGKIDWIDWNDWSYAGEISERIADLIGWEHAPRDPWTWWDSVRNEDTGFDRFSSDHGNNWFHPFLHVEHAILAADLIATRRKMPFELKCSAEGQWSASFPAGQARGFNDEIQKAVCEAILRLGDVGAPSRIFQKR